MSEIDSISNVGREIKRLRGGASGVDGECFYIPSPEQEMAIREIYEKYGDAVEISPQTVQKFGENLLVGTTEAEIQTLPAGVLSETYLSTNGITHISSSSASDTVDVVIEGSTVDGSGNFTFVSQTVTLSGQTKVALATPLARSRRGANMNGTDFVGDIYVYEDDILTAGVPDTGAKVHLIIKATENQSLKAAYTVQDGEYLLANLAYASVNEKGVAQGVIRMRVRGKGGVFRTLFKRGINSQGAALYHKMPDYAILPPNTDIVMTAEANTAGIEISGGFNGVIARIKVSA